MLRVTKEEENIGQDIYEMGSSALILKIIL